MKLLILKFVTRVRSAFWMRIAVVTGTNSWRFALDDARVKLNPSDDNDGVPPIILVAGRSQCYEIEKHIPADSWLEARRIANFLPVSSPFEGIRKTHLVHDERGGYTARICIINSKQIEHALPTRPIALIPSSWLFYTLANGQSVEIEFAGEKFGFSCERATNISTLLTSDSQKRDFWWAVGSEPGDIEEVSGDRVAERMGAALSALNAAQWIEAVKGNRFNAVVELRTIDWRTFGRTLGIQAFCYTLLVSIALAGGGVWAQNKAVEESGDLIRALELKGDINRLVSANQNWMAIAGEQHPVWAIWPVIEAISKDRVFVRDIRFESGSVETGLLAEDATEILNIVLNNPYARNVEFGSAIIKDRQTGFDSFSIRWDLYDARLEPDEVER